MAPDDHRPPSSLYEEDFFLWTQEQAAALRARGKDARIDYETLAEEIEDLGKRERREAMSRTATILEHLFKLSWSRREEPKGRRRATIVTQRADLLAMLSPSVRREVEADLEGLHLRGAQTARLQFETQEPDAPRNEALRWSLAQILGESDDPIG